MEATKVADGVRDLLEFMKSGDSTMAEQMTILRSTADLLNQIIVSEAYAASMVTAFRNIHDKK